MVHGEQAETRHAPGLAEEDVVVFNLHEEAGYASCRGEVGEDVTVQVLTGRPGQHAVKQGVWRVVVGPTGAGIGQVGEALGVRTLELATAVVQAGGHGQLVPDGDRGFLFGGTTGPAFTQVGAAGLIDVELALLLCETDEEGGEALARAGPVPAAVSREGAEVLLDDDTAVLQHDEGLAVAGLQEVEQGG